MLFEFLKKNKINKSFPLFFLLMAMLLILLGCHQKEEIKFESVTPDLADNETLCEQNRQEELIFPQSTIDFIPLGTIKLSHNSSSEVVSEIQDMTILNLMCDSAGIPREILKDITIKYIGSPPYRIELYWPKDKMYGFDGLSCKIEYYVDARIKGHTKKYVLEKLTTQNNKENISDPQLKDLLAERPELLVSWLEKKDIDETIDGTDDKFIRVMFILVDGDIAWCYTLFYSHEDVFEGLSEERRDAKEYDSKFQDVIRKAEEEASKTMRRENITGLGSCHTFWNLKKEYLKAKGIQWKSPSELNPYSSYD